MSNLKNIGPEPRGYRDAATIESLNKLNSELVQQSDLAGIVSSHFSNLDVVRNTEYDTFANPFATTANVNAEFQQYIKQNDSNLVYLDSQGYVPRSLFEQFMVTRPTVVTSFPGISAQPYMNNGLTRTLHTFTLPALPYETIPLVFGSFVVLRLGTPADVIIQARIGEGSSATVISYGSNVKVPNTQGLKSGYHTINMTPRNINSARLAPDVSHSIFLTMEVGTGTGAQEGFQSTQDPTNNKALSGVSVIQIPGGRDL